MKRKTENDYYLVYINEQVMTISAAAKCLNMERQTLYIRVVRALKTLNEYNDVINDYEVKIVRNKANSGMIAKLELSDVEITGQTKIKDVKKISNKLANLFLLDEIAGFNPSLSQIAEYPVTFYLSKKGFGKAMLLELTDILFQAKLSLKR